MWIVRVALQRPYTFIMLAVLIVLMGGYAILNTATDIFPNIKIPIAAVIWRYNGILPEEIANRIVLFSERIAQTTVNDVEHTESQSVNGTAVVKYFFQPDVDPDLSFAQITAVSQTQLAFSPPGTTPPFVLSYNASSVPILQLALSSDSLPEAQIYDLANTILRTQLATVAGASIPFPSAASSARCRSISTPRRCAPMACRPTMWSRRSARRTSSCRRAPRRSGTLEYYIKLNASPTQIDDLNNLPIRAHNGTVTYIRDVAHVRDGYSPQTNIVRVGGHRAVLMSVLKTGKASTIDIINSINQKLPQIRAAHACRAEDRGAQRSVGVRARGHLRRDPRGGDRRRADRPVDSAVSRQLAQHPDHHDFHSAVHPGLDRVFVRPGRDHQHHDPRRPGAGRGHSWWTTPP
jgi:multidrug efflux pump subunit AcrB